jgi:hypothetical protein
MLQTKIADKYDESSDFEENAGFREESGWKFLGENYHPFPALPQLK